MNARAQRYTIDGPAGKLEIALEMPDPSRRGAGESAEASPAGPVGLAFVAHPHPLFHGTMDNKVAQTLARTFAQLGYVAARLNFRGVGESEGEHDRGHGEQDDLLALIEHVRAMPGHRDLPFALAGFSFGAFVASSVGATLRARDDAAQRMVLVGTPAGRWQVPDVPADTLVIHGEQDETIPLTDVFDWARPQELPVVVIPGGEHFFHGKLHILKQVIVEDWRV
ncbi:alpha/beta hydrolase [Chitinasiproducens palmae]|uniref:Serine aminopeptidase S33 domain-containing protein n=1 Tax=Chitinasiproducens palmae TaxID=1770053 RepID=A0A1H2PNS9_9BURK|nr:alpha/beta hydrolase [Chitinasiproducens palmae]SDV48358.1 hypothetical protein SAMN05216551_10523 [Chitinasiproducens palmae]